MRTDSTVQSQPLLIVHACTKLGSLTFKPDEINKALESDGKYGAPLRGDVINREGVNKPYIRAKDPASTRKRVVAMFLSANQKDLQTPLSKVCFLFVAFCN